MDVTLMLKMCFGYSMTPKTDPTWVESSETCRRCGCHVPILMVHENVVGRPMSSQELHAMWHMAVEPVV